MTTKQIAHALPELNAVQVKLVQRWIAEARLHELGNVQLDYGNYRAMVFSGDVRIDILDRIAELESEK